MAGMFNLKTNATPWTAFYIKILVIVSATMLTTVTQGRPYDPADPLLDTVLPDKDGSDFEAFYAREAYGVSVGSSRPAHGHATFYQHRNPALVDANNAPAYGFRFDGGRRFNFD